MARFAGTLANLKEIAAAMPNAVAASSLPGTGRAKSDDLVKQLVAVLRKEDNDAITIGLLIELLIKKYSGRAV